jgi:hypothetical protein
MPLNLTLDHERQATRIAELTAANEAMQEDAVQNTYAFNLMRETNRSQAAEIEKLKAGIDEIDNSLKGDLPITRMVKDACKDLLKG